MTDENNDHSSYIFDFPMFLHTNGSLMHGFFQASFFPAMTLPGHVTVYCQHLCFLPKNVATATISSVILKNAPVQVGSQ